MFIIWVFLIFASLYSAQMYVVAELFTETWCSYCPVARAALRTMADNREAYPYLIPMIWQGDGANASPNYTPRRTFYGITSFPTCRWCGTDNVVGGGSGTLGEYIAKYNQKVVAESPIDIFLSYTVSDGIMHATATVVEESTPPNLSNPNVIFALTHNFDETQPGNYFASVVRYHQQAYDGPHSYTQDIELSPNWASENLILLVIVQNLSGNKLIYNAKPSNATTTPRPNNLIAYTGHSVISIKWDQPASEATILGFRVHRDGRLTTTTLLTEKFYSDTDVIPNVTYSYQVDTVFDGEDGEEISNLSLACSASLLTEEGLYQMGSGDAVNPNNGAGPINITARSLHGQFIYTVAELNLAGLVGASYINSIGFYVQQRPVTPCPQFVFRMKHTTQTNLAENISGPWEMIQFLPQYQPAIGDWRLIDLDEPFIWDGVSNIVIDTAFALTASSSSTGQVRVIPTGSTEGYRYVTSSSSNQTDVPTTTLASYKPQIRFMATANDVLLPPRDLTFTVESGFVSLTWDPPAIFADGFAGYRVYKNNTPNPALVQTETYHDNEVVEDSFYTYFVTAVYNNDTESIPSNTVEVTYVSEYDTTLKPTATRLGSNFPNPFNPSTTIYFDLHKPTNATLEIFNVKGQLVNTIAVGHFTSGRHFVNWDGLDQNKQTVTSGIYLYKLQTDDYVETKKMILLK